MTKSFRTPETIAKEQVLLRAGQWGCRLFKNNTGVAYTNDGRPVFFGLGNVGKKNDESFRTPDDVGWTPVTITQDMVGKTIPVFTAIDSKKLGFIAKKDYAKNTREYGQQKFFNMVVNANGIAGFACSQEDVDRIINEFYVRMSGK